MVQGVANRSVGYGYGLERATGFRSLETTGKAVGSGSDGSATPAAGPKALSQADQQRVADLKEIDRKVHAHEQAHISVGGDLVRGGATYTYQVGPDDRRYAVSGEVSIDASPGRTPEETIPKAQHIRATALAPVDPSAQDQSVAAKAGLMEANARIELATQQREKTGETTSAGSTFQNQSRVGVYQSVAQGDGSGRSTTGQWLNSFA